MKLYGYWRSSATYRVRIALALKEIDYEYRPINLLKGEQREASYLAINPLGLVPALETNDGNIIVQSLAIMEYLDEAAGGPALLPPNPDDRAAARAIAATLACEAQPFMNLRVQQYLKKDLGLDDDAVSAWLNRWPGSAMGAAEKMIEKSGGDFCIGEKPTIADCCLVPQMFGAERFGIDLSAMPRMKAIAERCNTLPAFQKAHPTNQPDAQ